VSCPRSSLTIYGASVPSLRRLAPRRRPRRLGPGRPPPPGGLRAGPGRAAGAASSGWNWGP